VATDLDRVVKRFTPQGSDYDSIFNIILVLSGKRTEIEQEQIPDTFVPVNGKWKMKCSSSVPLILPLPSPLTHKY
jgi:phenol 2-monooxygenase (NADPH)